MSRRVGPQGWAWHCDSPLLGSPSTLTRQKRCRRQDEAATARAKPRTQQGRWPPLRTQQRSAPARPCPRPDSQETQAVWGQTAGQQQSRPRQGIHTRTRTHREPPLPAPQHTLPAVRGMTAEVELLPIPRDGSQPQQRHRAGQSCVTRARKAHAEDGRPPLSPHSHPPLGRPPELCLHAGGHPTRWLSHPEGQRPGGHASPSPRRPAVQQASCSSGSPARPSCGQNAGGPDSHTGRPPAWKGHPL